MDDALVVGFLQRLGDLQGDRQRLVDRHRSVLQPLREVFTFDELEREKGVPVGLFEPVDGGDIRMIQGREQMGLAAEP